MLFFFNENDPVVAHLQFQLRKVFSPHIQLPVFIKLDKKIAFFLSVDEDADHDLKSFLLKPGRLRNCLRRLWSLKTPPD